MKTASLIISCQDLKGIIFQITAFLYELGANIVNLEQHIEDGMFFMRIEWDLEEFQLDEQGFCERFAPIVAQYGMQSRLDFGKDDKQIALFCSRELHCLLDIINRIQIGELQTKIAFVASNYDDAESVTNRFDIPFFHIPNGESQEAGLLALIKQYDLECVGLARYMKILSERFLQEADLPIINVHHSFLPSFVGAKPYDEAYERGVKLIGATSHFVTKELDQGQIIEQETLRVTHGNSVDEFKTLGRKCEKEVFAVALKKQLENKLIVYKNRAIVFS